MSDNPGQGNAGAGPPQCGTELSPSLEQLAAYKCLPGGPDMKFYEAAHNMERFRLRFEMNPIIDPKLRASLLQMTPSQIQTIRHLLQEPPWVQVVREAVEQDAAVRPILLLNVLDYLEAADVYKELYNGLPEGELKSVYGVMLGIFQDTMKLPRSPRRLDEAINLQQQAAWKR